MRKLGSVLPWVVLALISSACKSGSDSSSAAKGSAGNGATAGAALANTAPIKIGLLAPFTGPFASTGLEIRAGVRAYLAEHGEQVAGRKLEILERDTTGVAPEVAKRLAQSLVTTDHVQFLAGFALTPNAVAAADVATAAKVPLVVMNAATSSLTERSPYLVRVSFTLPQVSAPLAAWTFDSGVRKVYTLVSDYAPGVDAETEFTSAFKAKGGSVVDSVRVPLQNPDFAPYVQRIKDQAPEAVFIFLPTGSQGVGFMKTFGERGLAQAGIKLLATGDVTEDFQLPAMGEAALGVISAHHYSLAHVSPENEAFKAAFAKANAGQELRPNFMAVGGYDGMTAIAKVVEQLHGEIDGDRALAVLRGLSWQSPRGPVRIDPETRDVVQTVYIRRVEKQPTGFFNVEFAQFDAVVDPVKARAKTTAPTAVPPR
jgi:branched-chain amino acid transport system substrate-binding protein